MKDAHSSQDKTDEKDDIENITSILKNLLTDMLNLIVIETKLFGHTLLTMIGLSLVLAMLLVRWVAVPGAAVVIALASLQAFSLTSALR
ncbi:hypothetical protein [Nitrincola sp.]|uniref:hypothetical protein n=1 Tax=Nitrincola sp. TaxID=1926584 RepID=UPI003A9005E1